MFALCLSRICLNRNHNSSFPIFCQSGDMYQHSLSVSLSQDPDHSLRASIKESLGRSFDKSNVKSNANDPLLIASNNEPPTGANWTPKVIYSSVALLCFVILCIGVVVFIFISSQFTDTEINFDRQWFYDIILNEDFDNTNLPHGILLKQLNLTQPQQGVYRINFDRYWNYNGTHTMDLTISLNAQSRIIYNFAIAYKNNSYQPFLDAMYNGMHILLTQFYDNIYDGYYRQITLLPNKSYVVIDASKDSYHLSFAIKALCAAYTVTLNETYLHNATHIYRLLMNNFVDYTGTGLYYLLNENMTDAIPSGNIRKSDNNMLHFLHCLMKLYETYKVYYNSNNIVNGSMLIEISQRINAVYDFLMTLRVNATFTVGNDTAEYLVLPAEYDENWDAYEPYNRNINYGNGFEYTLFLWECINNGIIEWNDTNVWNANNIFDYSLHIGYNQSMKLFDSGTQGMEWWVGIEALRTMVYFYYENSYSNYSNSQLFTLIYDAHNGYKSEFYDRLYGGVYQNPLQYEYDKSGIWKVGYHVSESCFDILKWTRNI